MTNKEIMNVFSGKSVEEVIDTAAELDRKIKLMTKELDSYKKAIKALAEDGCRLETEKNRAVISLIVNTEVKVDEFIDSCTSKGLTNWKDALKVQKTAAAHLLSKREIEAISVETGTTSRISFKEL